MEVWKEESEEQIVEYLKGLDEALVRNICALDTHVGSVCRDNQNELYMSWIQKEFREYTRDAKSLYKFLKQINNDNVSIEFETLQKYPFNSLGKFVLFYQSIDADKLVKAKECVKREKSFDDVVYFKNNYYEWSTNCFENNLNALEPPDFVRDSTKGIKDQTTDIIIDHVFKDDIIKSRFLKEFYTGFEKMIGSYITFYNKRHRGNLTDKDIVLIFKGGNNMRIIVKNICKGLYNVLGGHMKAGKLKSTFEAILKDTHKSKSYFKNVFKKSDCDFSLYINPNKFRSIDDFYVVFDDMSKLSMMFLYYFKEHLAMTDFYGKINDAFFERFRTYDVSSLTFSDIGSFDIFVEDKIISGDAIEQNTTKKHKNPKRKNVFVFSRDKVDKTSKDYVDIITTKKLFSDVQSRVDEESNEVIMNINSPSDSSFYITYNNNLMINVANLKKWFDLIRIKYNVKVDIQYKEHEKNKEALLNAPGEVIDLTILHYDYFTLRNFFDDQDKNMYRYTYSHNSYMKFEYNMYSLEYLIYDLMYVMFTDFFNAWDDNKYDKRVNRLFMLIYLSLVDSVVNKNINMNDIQNEFSHARRAIMYPLSTIKYDFKVFKEIVAYVRQKGEFINALNVNDYEKYKTLQNPEKYNYTKTAQYVMLAKINNKKIDVTSRYISEAKRNFNMFKITLVKYINNVYSMLEETVGIIDKHGIRDKIHDVFNKREHDQW